MMIPFFFPTLFHGPYVISPVSLSIMTMKTVIIQGITSTQVQERKRPDNIIERLFRRMEVTVDLFVVL